METDEFLNELNNALNAKQEWFNSNCLPEILNQYRIVHACVKYMYEFFVQKSLIVPDPYRLDKRISEITVPESTMFSEPEIPNVFGARFSDYETMLDFICTYFRFSVENTSIQNIKKLMDFNAAFAWDDVSSNNSKMNTRALALVLNSARSGAPAVVISMLGDSVTKCADSIAKINKSLNELGVFQKELYKGELRKDLFEHPDFNKEKAFSSPENEMAEIKRLYPKVMGKKPFYTELINEIISEDQGAEKDNKRQAVLAKLKIEQKVKQTEKKQEINGKEFLMAGVLILGAMAPTLNLLHSKIKENFDLLFMKKKSLLRTLGKAFKKALHIKEKEKICQVPIKDPKTGAERIEKLKVHEFLSDLSHKERVYTVIATKGPEYSKIENSSEEAILSFLNKQISEAQSTFTLMNALDAYFKTAVDIMERAKVKGMQIELSAFRNSIVGANKKRGEYASFKEESEQMKRLGIKNV